MIVVGLQAYTYFNPPPTHTHFQVSLQYSIQSLSRSCNLSALHIKTQLWSQIHPEDEWWGDCVKTTVTLEMKPLSQVPKAEGVMGGGGWVA